MKMCTQCGEAGEFYKGASKCKECIKVAVRNNRAANLDYYREYDRLRAMSRKRVAARKAYAATERGKQVIRGVRERWLDRNAFKRVAQITVGNAIRDGKLLRKPCEKCGAKADAHHDDYSKPLDVRWLCRKHHMEHHRGVQ